MTNPWFRMYHEFATDPKVQMLSEVDQRRFVMLLCFRCCNGDVTLHDEEVAFQLRVSSDDWAETKARLIARQLIGEDNKPTKWDERQKPSDTSNQRVFRHRQKKKQDCNVTRNVTVTVQKEKKKEIREEEDKEKLASKSAKTIFEIEAAVWAACEWAMVHDSQSPEIIERWIADGADLDLDILPTVRALAERQGPMSIETYHYFTKAIMDAKRDREAGGGRYYNQEAAMAALVEKARRDQAEFEQFGTLNGKKVIQ